MTTATAARTFKPHSDWRVVFVPSFRAAEPQRTVCVFCPDGASWTNRNAGGFIYLRPDGSWAHVRCYHGHPRGYRWRTWERG